VLSDRRRPSADGADGAATKQMAQATPLIVD